MVSRVDIRFDATESPTLCRFLQSDARVRGIVGPFGSGKTSVCAAEILRRAFQQTPQADGIRRTRFVVVRNTYRELKDTTRKTFMDWIPEGAGHWRESDWTFRLQTKTVDCEVLFRALDHPGDIKRVLSLELTGAYINEAREVPKLIFDGLQGRIGRYPAMKDGGPSWEGLWFDTNPWPEGHWGHTLFVKNKSPEGFELFEQPSGLSPEAENLKHLKGGRQYYELLSLGKDSEFVDCYVHGRYPSSDEGSYFGALLSALQKRGGLLDFEHGRDGIFTTWDLGHGDATAIWFWRFRSDAGAPLLELPPGPAGTIRRVPEIVDHYEANGEPMSHYFDLVDKWGVERGYRYVKHCLPHDARQKHLETGQSILEMSLAQWGAGRVTIVPKLSIEDRIQAGRWLLEQPIRIHPRCSDKNAPDDTDGVECLRAYHKEWDEELKVYSSKPVHDWSSNSADAFTHVAVYLRVAEQNTRPEVKPLPPKVRSMHEWTLDELWAMESEDRGRIRRIP